MKNTRILSVILSLLLLGGCTNENVSSQEASTEPTTFGNIVWTEAADAETTQSSDHASGDVEPVGYTWTVADFAVSEPTGMAALILQTDGAGGFFLRNTVDEDGLWDSIFHCDGNGTVLNSTELPIHGDQDTSVGNIGIACGAEAIWFDYMVTETQGGGDQSGEYTSYVAVCDYNGNLIQSIPVDALFSPSENGTYLTGIAAWDTLCLLSTEHEVIAVDDSCNVVWEASTDRTIDELCVCSDESIYLKTAFDGDDVLRLDPNSRTISETLYTLSNSYFSIMPGVLGYDLLLSDNQNTTPKIYGLDVSSGVATPLFDVGALGMDAIGDIVETGTGLLVFHYANSISGFALGQLQQVPITNDTKILTLGVCGNISATAESAVALFNSRHTEYYLAITHYDSTEDLNLAIISGEGPDIICLSGLCAENYTKGHLYDLYSIMSADEKAEFVEAYRMEYEVDGALYTISPVFCYETLVGNSLIGETEVSSFVDLEQAALLQSSEGTVWYQMLPEAVLKELLSDTLTQFVDFSNNTCSFQTDEFYALLALCNYATGAADESRQPLYSITRYNLTNYRMPEFPAGVPLGLPKAGVLTTNPEDSFGISAYTSEPEAAWEFIQLLLTDDIQKGYASLTGYYPVCQEAYEIAVPADLREIVSSAKGHRISISPVLDIVLEEAQAYFSGDKTAAQVADYIQSRVEIYLSEQS